MRGPGLGEKSSKTRLDYESTSIKRRSQVGKYDSNQRLKDLVLLSKRAPEAHHTCSHAST